MSSSPGTSRYDLRPRKNSPDGRPTFGKETSEANSQSEGSDTEEAISDLNEIAVKSQDVESTDTTADETDGGVSCISAGTVKDESHHTDKSDIKTKYASTEKYDSRQYKENQSTPFSPQVGSTETSKNISCLLQIILLCLAICIPLVFKFNFIFGINKFNFSHTKIQINQFSDRPVAYRLGNLTTELEHLTAKYANLDNSFWDVIAGASWGHIQGDATFKRPVVLLLVGQPKSANLDVIANDVARLYSNVFSMTDDSTMYIDGGWQAMKEADQAKLDMDNHLKNGFSNGKKVVLIRQFDKLPPCSIMLFHSYCDNENAPHKDAVIIFTVELETTVSSTAQGIEELVQEHLGNIWAQCKEELLQDKIMAMHSRVSNNIAFVK
ncbi:torsin-1A-interacting protein 2-like [Lytechinus pictus]|uniref:torsin-1A-interacting protein 2-like n=1 Tax=Lytechinus pictus TaxID=7653 RepID=UPI0030BA2099